MQRLQCQQYWDNSHLGNQGIVVNCVGIKVWTGYRQSLFLSQSQLLLNHDIKGKAFCPNRPLLDFLAEYLDISPLSNITRDDMRRISRELKGKKVETSLKGKRRVFVVKGLTSENATYSKIRGQDNITLADYFSKNYEPFKYPHLPCIELRREVMYPLEVCEIVNQPVVCLANKQSSEIIKFTARSPMQRFHKIVESLKMSNEFKDTYLKGFGIIIENEPLKLEGRIIAAPKLSYDKQKIIKTKDGCWNMKNKQYFRASSVYSWIVISFSNCTSLHLERFTKLLSDIAAEHGMELRPVKNICIVCEPRPVVKVISNEMFHKFETDLMVVVLPEKDKTMYADVKEFSDSKFGLVTQCVKDVSVSKKCKPSVLSNLCQKNQR
ncbi:unnamed protein product [Larinioides sclopetarius]|uniref:PAZ domain-containing protein n=1 Tax=Larinioides sclopetarius TaxID=280406 RepID=A0AAV2BNG9_9ARAC